MSPTRKVVATWLASIAALCGCSGLQFRQDQRLTFTSPRADALTTVPVRLSWSMKQYRTRLGGNEYAVFVDIAPIKVGQSLRSLVPPKTTQDAVLPLLNAKNIYETPATSIVLTHIPDIPYDTDRRQRHTVTVILVDASGKRTAESAWTRSFDLHALNNGGLT